MRFFLMTFLLLGVLSSAAVAQEDYRLLRIEGDNLKWGDPQYGTGADVSYGFATATTAFPDAVNCRGIEPMDKIAHVWGVNRGRLEQIAAKAFGMWSGAADLSFRPARAGETPDILIGTQTDPRGVAWANVWHDAAAARNGLAPMRQASICFNPEQIWTVDQRTPRGAYDLLTVLAHEIGHTIGLDHPSAKGPLMGFRNQGQMKGLLPGDIMGAVALYGPRR